MKIGSLFDGSGGFPLAATMCGIEPVWASEVEPYPIAVTRSRFPNMKHLGSVTDINGAEVEPVDIITFGSPCQDLSVAGKRAGLKHTENGDEETTRSGLFMEAVRIIKEMREATNGVYPRFALWENVPGAFSSNKGEDFRIVLEELIKIVKPTAVMPTVPQNGWPYADSYCGDGWSLAYRVFDAQFWGVPQRRRRIYLVADFRGKCAGQVSFEREGLRGYFETGRTPWQETAGDAESGIGTADCTGGCVAYSFDSLASNSMKSSNPNSGCRQVEVAKCLDTTDPNPSKNQGGIAIVEPVPYTLKIRTGVAVDSAGKAAGKGALIQTNKAATLAVAQDQYLFQPVVSAGFKAGQSMAGGIGWQEETAATLAAQCSGTEPTVCVKTWDARGNGDGDIANTITGDHENRITDYTSVVVYESHPMDSRIKELEDGVSPTVSVKWHKGTADTPLVCEKKPVYCIEGNGVRPSHKGDGYSESDAMYTLNTIERHAVCYKETYQKATGPLMANSHPGSYTGQDAYNDMLVVGKEDVAGVDCRNLTEHDELYPTLQAKPNGGQSLNFSGAVRVRYIVRRLTPTECARLQGFPDNWGHPDIKAELTDEEYDFWLNVRNTHAAINDKATKEYTREQMLSWYSKLHTDSSEYKMWGNGIALPCALYVMQGIAEALQ